MNAPQISEQFTLPNGKKVEYEDDTKAKNAGNFVFHLEDHTMGCLLKKQLLRNESIRFAAYRRPHPLENLIEMKVHTNGEVAPKESMVKAVDQLSLEFEKVKEKFLAQLTEDKKNIGNDE